MKFKRGDLILDKSSYRYFSYNVYLLICFREHSEFSENWWVKDFGELPYKDYWSKQLITSADLHEEYCIKLKPEDLEEDKRNAYQEFKEKYMNTDIV
jgi:hypothetical protein